MRKYLLLTWTSKSYLLLSGVVFLLLGNFNFSGLTLREESPKTRTNCQSQDLSTSKLSVNSTQFDQIQTCPLIFNTCSACMREPIPYIQYEGQLRNDPVENFERAERRKSVKIAFQHSWDGYRKFAWLWDEISPISGGHKNTLGGWGATLVDSLDTLLIMGLDDEFDEALQYLANIDFSTPGAPSINVFETNIRYLGGLLSAYDLSGGNHPILLQKGRQLGDFMCGAFDTPNGIPQTRWRWSEPKLNNATRKRENTMLAELGSFTLEFTRLSQLTGDAKYFEAVQRIVNTLNDTQSSTKLPGLWPVFLDPCTLQSSSAVFTVGSMADSTYEYLVKEYILLGGQSNQYRDMYISAMESIKQNLLFHGMNKDGRKITFAGNIRFDPSSGQEIFEYQTEHLKCFLGGMVGLGAKVFNRPSDLSIARKLVDGCIWAYDLMPTGIMPETLYLSGCRNSTCDWDEEKWLRGILTWPEEEVMPLNIRNAAEETVMMYGLKAPVLEVADPRYRLRPEAIESMFILYRITGDKSLQDAAWRMFENIEKHTKVKHGYAELNDTRNEQSGNLDSMESFWLAETLKYFYLIFSDDDVLSLDDYVFNTEGHPLKYTTSSPRTY